MKLKSITLTTAALLLSTSVNAALLFTNRISFESAVTVGQFIDFEAPFSNGSSITFGDATFISTNNTGLFRTNANEFGSLETRLASQNTDGIRIELASGWTSLGLDVGELFAGASTGTFTLRDSSNTIIDSITLDIGHFGPTPSFIGWINDVDIGSMEFFASGTNSFEAIDNVILSNTISAVPVPAAAWLFGSGIIGLIGFVRRKKV